MTLEDFFTLTEMKDGLTAHTRVEELVTVMQKEKDCTVKNIGEAARQWATVAGTLAATENKDCLDLFIRLDGLLFLNRWIQEAQKCSNDMGDSFVEESVTALLGALEKLPIDWERSVSSGIEATIRNLCGHKSSRVQDAAKALFDSWNPGRDKNMDIQDLEKSMACLDDEVSTSVELGMKSGSPQQSIVDDSQLKENANMSNRDVELAGGERSQSTNSDGSKPKNIKDVKRETYNGQDASCTTLSHTDKDDAFRDGLNSSVMLNHGQESLSIVEEACIHPAEGNTSTGACSSPVPVKGNADCKAQDAPNPGDAKETDMLKCCLDKFGTKEKSYVSSTSGYECVSSITDPTNTQESVVEPSVPNDVDAKQSDFSLKKTIHLGLETDVCTTASNPTKGVVDCAMLNHSRNILKLKVRNQDGECYPNVLQKLTSNGCKSRKADYPETSFSRREVIGAVTDVKRLSSESTIEADGEEDLKFTADVSKPTGATKDADKIEKRSDMELEYGVDDALEVAWQVAKEVEQEMGDYREPSCSSSEKKSGGVQLPSSPDSINGEQDVHVNGPVSDLPAGQNLSTGSSPSKEEGHLMGSENMDTKPEDYMQEIESSQVTEAAQEQATKTMKGICVFDLNEEVHSEEMDHATTPISAPISVTAASRAAAAPGLPVSPLQFEGALGWRGSAATSAFRPASPRRILEGSKTTSIEGSSHSSKQRQDFLQIDLNVAGSDDAVPDLTSRKQTPVSSGLPSGESSIEVSSKRAATVKFDLNRVSDNDDVPSLDWNIEGSSLDHRRNGHRSPSPASSSSSRPLSMRNIDLNDCPTLVDESHYRVPDLGKLSSQDMNAYGLQKPSDPVISIMGTRVEIGGRKELIPQTRSFLPNGLVAESTVGAANSATTAGGVGMQPPMTYTPSPAFGFNGFAMGPSMSLSSAVYGPGSIPYMVDSRGAPVLPHMMGGPAAAVPAPYSRPPFLMGLTGPPSGLNEIGSTRPNFDLNSGWMMAEGRNRESGGSRHLFIQEQGGLMEEQMRSGLQSLASGNGGSRESGGSRHLFIHEQGASMEDQMRSGLQSLTSGNGDKRKEPEGGWESFPFIYKQQHPPPPRWP